MRRIREPLSSTEWSTPVGVRTTILLLSICAVACSTSSSGRPPHPPAADLVVATYNVNFGMAGDGPTIQAIRATGADVVLLQETTPEWEAALRRALGRRYPHMLFRHSDWPAGGMAFLSRHPLSDLKSSPSVLGYFPAWRVVVHCPAGPVRLVNLHLKPAVSDSGSYVSGYFTTPPQRKAEMTAHLHLVRAEGPPTIVMGDFNEQRGGGLSVLEHQRFEPAITSQGAAPTWRWKVGPFTLRQQLDHILYDPARLRCVDARILDRGRSDHLPVVAQFQLVRTREG